MDGRKALTPGTKLHFQNRNGGEVSYTITQEIGRGGSCIVYDASYQDNLGNHKLVRLKECYPHGLKLIRTESGDLLAEDRDRDAFKAAQKRMKEAYQRNHDLFVQDALTNAMTNTADLYEAFGTIWIVSTWLNGSTMAEMHPKSLKDCISLVLATAKVLQRIHEAGYLYLDLKPENIMTIRGVTELVQLFDFDSMISLSDLEHAKASRDASALRTSYTKGFAPLEQQTGKLAQLGPWSDVYSLGAVLFAMLWGKTPTAFDCAVDAVYDYSHFSFSAFHYQDRLYRGLTEFFHRTLASYIRDRYPSIAEAAAQLEQMVLWSDEQKPYIISSFLPTEDGFYGREEELSALSDLLDDSHSVVSLSGMGGIGKSTLVRHHLMLHRDQYDAILYTYDHGSANDILTDDQLVTVNTIHRQKEETAEEYFARKKDALKVICAEQKALLVLDQFDPDHWNDLQSLFDIGWQVLLISREKLPEGLCPSMNLEEMQAADLAGLFAHYAHQPLQEKADVKAFIALANAVYGHTLTMELIARQIAKSHLTLQEAAEMVDSAGFKALPTDQIDYLRDSKVMRATLTKVLDQLMAVDSFTDDDRLLVQELALFDLPGIDASLFRSLTGRAQLDHLNDLEEGGWVKVNERKLALHPLMQEVVRSWPWNKTMDQAAEQMAEGLYQQICPDGQRHDTDKQSPEDYDRLYELLGIADQLQAHSQKVSPASQRLRYRILMDAPVDQDEWTAMRMVHLLENPQGLDDGSILRLYETSAYLFGRMECYGDAFDQLKQMKAYLLRHPSAFYLSGYHRAMAVLTHNAALRDHVKICLRHEDQAIAAARLSKHPDAKKQLAASLLDKTSTLLDAGKDMPQCQRLIAEATPLVKKYTDDSDYERYQFYCISAMYYAMNGQREQSIRQMKEADRIASERQDSPLSYIEHKLDEEVPIYMVMGDTVTAIALMDWAIEECSKREEMSVYRRTRFSAWYSLARTYEEAGDFIWAEETYMLMDEHREDSPWEIDEDDSFCPLEVEAAAEAERGRVEQE